MNLLRQQQLRVSPKESFVRREFCTGSVLPGSELQTTHWFTRNAESERSRRFVVLWVFPSVFELVAPLYELSGLKSRFQGAIRKGTFRIAPRAELRK